MLKQKQVDKVIDELNRLGVHMMDIPEDNRKKMFELEEGMDSMKELLEWRRLALEGKK